MDLCLEGDFIYALTLEGGYYGLKILNVSDPANIIYMGGISRQGWLDIQVIGDYAYMVGVYGFAIVDISNRTNPTIVGRTSVLYYIYESYVSGIGIYQSFAIRDDIAYIATRSQGLFVFNISNVSNISLVAYLEIADLNLNDIWVEGTCAFVCTWKGEIWVVDISDPTTPTLIASYIGGEENNFQSCQVNGDYLYVVLLDYGLKIFDVSKYISPRQATIPGYPFPFLVLIGAFTWVLLIAKKKDFFFYSTF
jgi:hypothetical protein